MHAKSRFASSEYPPSSRESGLSEDGFGSTVDEGQRAAVVQQDWIVDRFRRALVAFVGILRNAGERLRTVRFDGASGCGAPGSTTLLKISLEPQLPLPQNHRPRSRK
jgi:hypothetical protein